MWHQMPRGGVRPMHCLAKAGRGGHHVLGQDAVADDALLVVDVLQEQVERGDSLLQPALQPLPFVVTDDPRDDVERNDPLGALPVAVDVERDAKLDHRAVGGPLPANQVVRRHAAHPLEQRLAIGPRPARAVEHFVIKAGRLVAGEGTPAIGHAL